MTMSWTDPAYGAVADALRARTGLVFPSARQDEAETAIRRAMARSGSADPAEYAARFAENAVDQDALVEELTVGETYFFRDPAHFDFIRREVLPSISRGPAGGAGIRAWSAGCASGEEAYSLAILFEEEGLSAAHILATDISRRSIEKARAGVYGSWSLRSVKTELIERYFRHARGQYSLDSRFKSRVRLERLNLALDQYPSLAAGACGMHLILCRNVLIYFDRATIRAVSARLAAALTPGGWLITGPSDPLPGDLPGCEAVVTSAGVFYRRVPAGEARPAPRRMPPPQIMEEPAAAWTAHEAPLPSSEEPARTAPAIQAAAPAPEDPATIEAVGIRTLAGRGRIPEACVAAAAAVARRPLSLELHLLHALLLLDLGRIPEAANAARKAAYLDRDFEVVQFALGMILGRLGDRRGAASAYARVISLCDRRPADEEVPLSDGERAGRLAEAARAQVAALAEAA